jgi:lipopolysaccharide assembly outer membrane protein LptD (OstA)
MALISHGQEPVLPSQRIEPVLPVINKPVDSINLIKTDLLKIQKPADSIKKDSVKVKNRLENKLTYDAVSYTILDRKVNTMTLYNQAVVTYGDIKIEAGKIIINNKTGNIEAYGIPEDSTGIYSQKPIFTQGTNVIKPDSIIANRFSKKVLTYNATTLQGEFNVIADVTKRVNDSVIYMQNARFTTSKDPANPEYYFKANRIKFVPGKKIVTGLVQMYIADVPTPLGLPFGFFPMTTERKSGIIIPSFGNNNNQGYFLQNGGYYFAVNDYVDLTVLGDYFTNGSYGARVESNYKERYKYAGSLRFLYENQLQSERGFSDFQQTSRYNINWQHAQDAKTNPTSRFSASVNLGSSQFYRQSFNQINQGATLVNNLSSSIAYNKTFTGEPQVNLTASATHNQNTNTDVVNLSLPNLQANVSRVFPFAPKEGVRKGIIHNINLQYSVRSENRIATSDTDFLTAKMFDNAVFGVRHSIPLSTNFKIAKYFNVGVNANYDESWVFETYNQTLVANGNGGFNTRRDTVRGFDAFRTYNYGANIGTTVYGSWQSTNKEAKIQAIRHIIRPSVTYNVNPSFDQYYNRLLDEQGLDVLPEERFYSRFEGSLYGVPGRNFSSNVGFNVQNNIEAKIRERDSTKTELKNISILKSLNFNTSYNIAGDSLNWSPVQMSGVIPLTSKVDLNFDANFDPYALDNNNNRINTFNIANGGSLFRLTRAGARVGFRLSDKDFVKKDTPAEKDAKEKVNSTTFKSGGRDDDLFGAAVDFAGSENFDPNAPPEEQEVDISKSRYRFKIPWNLNVSYTMTYENAQRQSSLNRQSLMLSGDLELSPRWSLGGNTGYDFAERGISFTTIRFERDLESWRMSFNWTPVGPRNSWFFFIGIKSGALSDIKWDQRKQPDPLF